jgi:hypothetical protein
VPEVMLLPEDVSFAVMLLIFDMKDTCSSNDMYGIGNSLCVAMICSI